MKLIAGTLSLLVGINLLFPKESLAKFAVPQIRNVPISRLLKNLEIHRSDVVGTMDRAMIDFQIGRLHSMAYALGVEEGPCNALVTPGSKYELPDFGNRPDHLQFAVDKTKAKPNSPQAKQHLQQAILHMQAALRTDPKLVVARLGLAWCYEQSGDKANALKSYRQAFAEAYDQEKYSKGGMYNWSIGLETAGYLQKLLDPVKDSKELKQLKDKTAELESVPRMVTPIAIPLKRNCSSSGMLIQKEVLFDLDGFGKKRYTQWLSPNAAWLVFNPDSSGKIDSGLQLVGQSSFWIFWRNGYDVLRSLDDDHDGLLKANELAGMALWCDRNSDGISNSSEIESLASHGITALRCSHTKNSAGMEWNSAGVMFSDGHSVPSFDLLLQQAAPPQAFPGRATRVQNIPSIR